MMEAVIRVKELDANPNEGTVVVDWNKALWNASIITTSLILAPLYANPSAILLFVLLTYLSLLVGHSVGMHRMMIHRSFVAPKYVERFLIYIGVLVGMSGPIGVIRIHDLRDWAQRQPNCAAFFSHSQPLIKDLMWQLFCKFKFDKEPQLVIEERYRDDWFYKFLDKTWRFHQLPVAALLYFVGGMPFLVWGIFVRISFSIIGHWTITHFCHRSDIKHANSGKWRVKASGVQAVNLNGLGILTYGECWHNNHHAFPESAKIGLEKGQADPAWWFIQGLSRLGLAKNIHLPRDKHKREDLEVVI